MSINKMMAITVVGIMFLSSMSFLIDFRSDVDEVRTQTTVYSNSDISSVWVRKNGSDPGFPYGGSGVTPIYGMTYFGTNVIQVTWDYNLTEISSSIFPSDAEIYVQAQYDPVYYATIADFALTDSRIKGAFIDDFEVGRQSPSNMSGYYTNLSHNDGALGYHLSLGIVVYNRNYFVQSPYSWNDISSYFDIIHWWYYPFTYGLLYPGLAGYEDDFKTLHSWLPEKDYWMGIYLHYYNVGDYPLNFTSEQLSVAGKLMKTGLASRFSILENFWIQHNPETSELVRDFINDEYQSVYLSTWTWAGGSTVLSYNNGLPSITPLISDLVGKNYFIVRTFYTFHSAVLQNMTVANVGDDYMVWNLRNGNYQFPYYFDASIQSSSYILEPNQDYKMMSFPLSDLYLNGTTYINSSIIYTSRHIIVNGELNISDRLQLNYCIVDFGNNNFENSMYNSTRPDFGIEIMAKTDAELAVYDSIIEPMNRAYPYHFERVYGTAGSDGTLNFLFARSIVACHAGKLRPSGEIWITDSTFFQVQPVGATINSLLWLETPSYITALDIENTLFWNYDISGSIGVFIMPGTLFSTLPSTHLVFDHNTIIGGNWGLWVDFHYSNSITIRNYTTYSASDADTFTAFRLDGTSDKRLTVETDNIYSWAIKNVATGPDFTIQYTYIPDGMYVLTVDGTATYVSTQENTLAITYQGPWLAYRDNFTLAPFGTFSSSNDIIMSLVWLLIIFLVPIVLGAIVPRIGFLSGMILMLLVIGFTNTSFMVFTVLGLFAIAISFFKGD